MSSHKSIVVVFKSDGMGITAPEAQPLRETLAQKFLALLADAGDASDASVLPDAICFYTDGVKLVCEGSPVLAEFQALEARHVRLIICKTCLDYFGLAGQVRAGIVGGMTDIITAMWGADTVITL